MYILNTYLYNRIFLPLKRKEENQSNNIHLSVCLCLSTHLRVIYLFARCSFTPLWRDVFRRQSHCLLRSFSSVFHCPDLLRNSCSSVNSTLVSSEAIWKPVFFPKPPKQFWCCLTKPIHCQRVFACSPCPCSLSSAAFSTSSPLESPV